MNEYINILIRAIVAVAFLFIIAKSIGAKQISQLSFFDYILGITIGSIAGALCVDVEIDFLHPLLAMAVFAICDIIVSIVSRKTIWGRRLFSGSPTFLISNGEILYKGLKRVHLDMDDLLRELRVQGYFNISDIEYAVLETNGALSLLQKEAKRPVNTEDMNVQKEEQEIFANVIIDGKIMESNLEAMKKDTVWLNGELKKQGITESDNILLAILKVDGTLSVFSKNKNEQKRTVFQ